MSRIRQPRAAKTAKLATRTQKDTVYNFIAGHYSTCGGSMSAREVATRLKIGVASVCRYGALVAANRKPRMPGRPPHDRVGEDIDRLMNMPQCSERTAREHGEWLARIESGEVRMTDEERQVAWLDAYLSLGTCKAKGLSGIEAVTWFKYQALDSKAARDDALAGALYGRLDSYGGEDLPARARRVPRRPI